MKTRKLTLSSLGIRKVAEAEGISEYRLKNGLKILLKQNRVAPVVNFMVLYPCGSRDEGAGNTGSAHFFEHLMFKGTRAFDPQEGNGPMEVFARIGAFINANTSRDRTRYFECLPSEHLELAIRLEADRMRGLKNRKADRDSEMTVVRNEFERGENNPGSALYKAVCAAAFDAHPYHHSVIGHRSDVEGIPLSRMVEFYNQHYWPNNAVAIVVGDFDNDEALRLIAKYFGRLPRSPKPIPTVYTVEPPQEGEKRVEVRRNGELEELLIAYHVPQADHADTYALSAMTMILGGGNPTSRLYKALVEPGLVSSTSCGSDQNRDPGLFMVDGTLTPGTTFEAVEKVIFEELARLAAEPVSEEELTRAKKANRKGTVLGNDDPKNFTDMISNAEGVATWRWSVEYDDKFDAVQPSDIMRVAATYFASTNRTVGHFIPTVKESKAEAIEETAAVKPAAPKAVRPRKVKRTKLAASKERNPIGPRVVRRVLPNGLTVQVLANKGTGSIAVNGKLFAGAAYATDKALVPGVTASMLTRGSKAYSKLDLGGILQEMGTRFGFRTENFGTGFSTLLAAEDFTVFMKLAADVMRNPLFDNEELTKLKRQFTASLMGEVNDTGARSYKGLMEAIYPVGHPFRKKSAQDLLAELATITSADLRAFHAAHYSPKSTILTVVGDVEPEAAIALVTELFGTWDGPERKTIVVPAENAPEAARTIEIEIADKANVDIVIGLPTELNRRSEDFFAAQIANHALGADTIADRLGKMIRVRHGLTYGVNSSFGDVSFGAAPWTVELSVNPANVDKALALVKEVVASYVASGISDEEFEDKVSQLTGSFTVRLRSSVGIADALASYEFIGLGVEGMDALVAGYRSVTKEQVNAAIRKYFTLDKAVTVLAGTLS